MARPAQPWQDAEARAVEHGNERLQGRHEEATGKIWQARLLIDGELRHVKSSRRKRECAIALAQAKEMLAGEKRVKELCSKWHPRPAAARLEGPFSMPVPALGESNEKALCP